MSPRSKIHDKYDPDISIRVEQESPNKALEKELSDATITLKGINS